MVISRRSSQKFADLASSHGVVRTIEQVYEAHDFVAPADYQYPNSGVRRAICDAYERDLDRSDSEVSARLLLVYADGIEDWGRKEDDWNAIGKVDQDPFVLEARVLIRSLQRDGASIGDDGRVAPTPAVVSAPLGLDRFERLSDPSVLQEHLKRIDATIESDPAAAIGSAKELVESTFKFVLEDYGVAYSAKATMPDLYKSVADQLGLNRESVPESVRGSEAAQRVLQGLITAVQNLAALRNELGVGHGRTTTSPAQPRHGRLAANSARTVVEFVLDTWHARRDV